MGREEQKAAARLLECENVRQNETITGLSSPVRSRLPSAKTGAKFPCTIQPAAPGTTRQDKQKFSYFCFIGGNINLFSRLHGQKCDALSSERSRAYRAGTRTELPGCADYYNIKNVMF
jgi:hypothetical protein